ncbi:MAG: maleylpyruvate isomerase family mycothiol-dependent enzyme [Anaerolinea sp.]|nr:maleylpyruvate isomerase family mycothiol-dependent enzyme [Anaerolinea sp.]
MIDEIATVIRELDDARAAMRTVMEKFDRKTIIYPGWTLKHILAHVTGWDEAAANSIEAHMRGGESAIDAYQGVAEYNEKSVETRRELTFELTVREWEYERERLKKALREITPEQWNTPLMFPWGGYGLAINLVRVWSRHEHDHARELQELISRSAITFIDAPDDLPRAE